MFRAACLIIFCLITGCTSSNFKQTPQTDLLRDRDFKKVLIEVVYFEKLSPAPTKADLDYLESKVSYYCHKDTIVVKIEDPKPIASVGTLLWDKASLIKAEDRLFSLQTAGDTLVLHIIYAPGHYISSPSILGLAYGDYAFVVFRNNFSQSQERGVLLHEFGHLVGLVNAGTALQTDHEEQDQKHLLHCKNNCVMHWFSPDTQYPDFDPACREDLSCNGGK